MLTINVVTLFPEVFEAALATSIPGRAAEAGLVRYRVVPLRDYTHDKHRTVDDTPYGGGAGMVLKPEPFFEAVEDLGARPGVHAPGRGAVVAGDGADAALRPLQGRGSTRRRGPRGRGAVGRGLRALGRGARRLVRPRRGGAAVARRAGRPRVRGRRLAL